MEAAGLGFVDARGGKMMDENEMDGWGEESRLDGDGTVST